MDLHPPENLPVMPIEPASGPTPPVPPPIQAMPVPAAPADDMFSAVEPMSAPSSVSMPTPTPVPNPIAPPQVPSPTPTRVLPPLPEAHRPPVLHYVLIALAVVIVLGLIAGAVWFFAIRRPAQQVMENLPSVPSAMTSSTEDGLSNGSQTVSDEPIDAEPTFGEPEVIPSKPIVQPPTGSNVPLPTSIDPNASPAPIVTDSPSMDPAPTASSTPPMIPPTADQDQDGLSDARETELGTNPAMADTDGDGLTDGDEVLKYRTNPLVPDTDGDSFPDGVEVQKGYNPLGSGTCATPTCTR